MAVPELIVFDLDFTLWDCGGTWCDCLTPPFDAQAGRVFDRTGRHVRLYDDVLAILDQCDKLAIPLAVASRTEQPSWAEELLDRLQITERFTYAEIYPTGKLEHFAALRASADTDFNNMLFFDDEMRNIRDVTALGVTCIHVTDGMHHRLFKDSLLRFASQ